MSVPSRTLQIAFAVYRTIMRIPKFQDRLTRFYLLSPLDPTNGFILYTEDESRYLLSDVVFNGRAEHEAIKQAVTSRLVAAGFQLDRFIYSTSAHIRLPIEPIQSNVTVETTPKAILSNHKSFFSAVCLTPEQLERVQVELPVGAPAGELRILNGFTAKMLSDCGLDRLQISTWEMLLAKQFFAKDSTAIELL